MTPEKYRALFTHAELLSTSEHDYIDWYVAEHGKNAAKRLITLTYDVDSRLFYAVLQRSETNDSDFNDGVTLPHKMVELLRSVLTPEHIALCTATSIRLSQPEPQAIAI